MIVVQKRVLHIFYDLLATTVAYLLQFLLRIGRYFFSARAFKQAPPILL